VGDGDGLRLGDGLGDGALGDDGDEEGVGVGSGLEDEVGEVTGGTGAVVVGCALGTGPGALGAGLPPAGWCTGRWPEPGCGATVPPGGAEAPIAAPPGPAPCGPGVK
jgi:hypothetical protein